MKSILSGILGPFVPVLLVFTFCNLSFVPNFRKYCNIPEPNCTVNRFPVIYETFSRETVIVVIKIITIIMVPYLYHFETGHRLMELYIVRQCCCLFDTFCVIVLPEVFMCRRCNPQDVQHTWLLSSDRQIISVNLNCFVEFVDQP